MQARAIEDSGVVVTLDELERLQVARTEADARMFELAAHFADLHCADSVPAPQRVLPGRERAVQVGGVGTPRIAEFAYAELGARLAMSSWSARRLVADALDVRHRLPRTWERVVARQARIGSARTVASATRHLSVEAAGRVDAAMAPFVDGSLPWGRFLTRLEGKVVAADPALAAAREEERAGAQFAKRTRAADSGAGAGAGAGAGIAGFYVRSTVGLVARLDASVAFVAQALAAFGDRDSEELRRVKAVAVLANPTQAVELLAAFAALRSHPNGHHQNGNHQHDPDGGSDPDPQAEGTVDPSTGPLERMDAFARRVGFTPTRLPATLQPTQPDPDAGVSAGFVFDWSRLLPPLTLNLHVAAETLAAHPQGDNAGGVVRWDGEGPITPQFVHEHLRPLHRYRIQPVIDLAGQAPADAYEIPDRHRRAVRLRTPADCFPYASHVPDIDVDHTQPYTPEAQLQSRMDNYGPLGRYHHRVKTHGLWTVRQPFDGIYLWRDPHGQLYLVDHTGTRKLTRPGQQVSPAPEPVLEIDFSGGSSPRAG